MKCPHCGKKIKRSDLNDDGQVFMTLILIGSFIAYLIWFAVNS